MPDTMAVIRLAFNDISDAELEMLCRVAALRTYPAEQVLCHEGELEHTFYIVAAGQVAISHRLSPNEERLITLLSPGGFFGEMALLEHKPRSAPARAGSETTVREVSEAGCNSLMAAS